MRGCRRRKQRVDCLHNGHTFPANPRTTFITPWLDQGLLGQLKTLLLGELADRSARLSNSSRPFPAEFLGELFNCVGTVSGKGVVPLNQPRRDMLTPAAAYWNLTSLGRNGCLCCAWEQYGEPKRYVYPVESRPACFAQGLAASCEGNQEHRGGQGGCSCRPCVCLGIQYKVSPWIIDGCKIVTEKQ
jgi:hypothetical protein